MVKVDRSLISSGLEKVLNSSYFNSDGTKTLQFRLDRGAISFEGDPGLTEQFHKDSCDINIIMAQVEKSGVVPVPVSSVPRYGDFTGVGDYLDACLLVKQAEESFMSLPAKVRREFNDDPSEFLAAVEDSDQRQRLIDCGLLVDDQNVGSDGSNDSTEAKPTVT